MRIVSVHIFILKIFLSKYYVPVWQSFSHQASILKGVGLKCHAYSSNFVGKSKLDLVMHNIVKTHSLLILWFLHLVVSGNKRHFWLCLNWWNKIRVKNKTCIIRKWVYPITMTKLIKWNIHIIAFRSTYKHSTNNRSKNVNIFYSTLVYDIFKASISIHCILRKLS